MKRNIFVALLALVSSITVSMAQPSRGGEHGGRGQRNRPVTEQNTQVMAAKQVASLKVRLALNEEQEKQASEIVSKFYTSKPTQDVIPADATNEQRQKARADMKQTRVQMNSDIKSILSDDQKAKYDEMLAQPKGRGKSSQKRR